MFNDALFIVWSIGLDPKSGSTFGSDALAEQCSDQFKQSFRANGLFDKVSALRQVPGCRGHAPRCDHDANILSIIPHSAGQLKAIDAPAWHFHVRDDHLNVRNGGENMKRLIRVSCLHDLEASIIKHVRQHHADEGFVLDHENESANVRFVLRQVE